MENKDSKRIDIIMFLKTFILSLNNIKTNFNNGIMSVSQLKNMIMFKIAGDDEIKILDELVESVVGSDQDVKENDGGKGRAKVYRTSNFVSASSIPAYDQPAA